MKNLLLGFIGFLLLSNTFTFSQNQTTNSNSENVGVFFRIGHNTSVIRSAINPDGKTFATLDVGNFIVIWDIKTQLQINEINGKDDAISIMLFSPDGKYLIGAGTNRDGMFSKAKSKRLIYWDAHTGKQVKAIKLESTIIDMNFTPDGRLASFEEGFGGTKLIYRDIETGNMLSEQKIAGFLPIPDNFAFSPDGKYLMVGTKSTASSAKNIAKDLLLNSSKKSKEGFIIIQDLATNKLVKEIYITAPPSGFGYGNAQFMPHPCQMKFTPDGKYLLMGGSYSDGYSLKVLDMQTLEIVKQFNNQQFIQGLVITPDGKYFYTTSSLSNEVQKWDANTFQVVSKIDLISPANDLKITPDGKQFITVGGDAKAKTNDIYIWDIASDKQIGSFDEMITEATDVAFSKDGKQMLIGSNDGQAQLIDLTNGSLLKTFDVSNESTLNFGFGKTTVRFSSDGKYIITSAIDMSHFRMTGFLKMEMAQNTKLWDTKTFQLVKEYTGSGQAMVNPVLNQMVISKKKGSKSEVSILNFETEQELFKDNFTSATFFEYSPDGKTFITSKISGLNSLSFRVWDATTMKEMLNPKKIDVNNGEIITCVRYSPDGKKLVVSVGAPIKWRGRVYEIDAVTGEIIHLLFDSKNTSPNSVCYSPDGKYIVTGEMAENLESKIKIYDAQLGNCIDSVLNEGIPFQFTNDGKYLIALTGAIKKSVNLINFNTRKIFLSYYKIKRKDDCILITPDNYYKMTPGAYDAVAFKKGDNIYPFEQFDLTYNRPDILAKNLPYADASIIDLYKSAHEKRLKKLGFTENKQINNLNAPTVKVSNGIDIPITSSTKTIALKLNAKDEMFNIKKLEVWVNDVPIADLDKINVTIGKSKNIDKEVAITLSKGRNKIQVAAVNEQGVESLKETVYTNFIADGAKNNLYVLTIGISDYTYGESDYDLTYAAKDANDIAAFFDSQQDQYNHVFIKKILNSEATKENIIAAKQFLSGSTVDDNVVLFYAGHGLLDKNLDYYFSTADCDFNDPAVRGLSYDEMDNLLNGIASRKKLMLIDACNSGEVDKDETGVSASVVEQGNSNIKSRGFKTFQTKNVGQASVFSLMQQLFTDIRRGNGAVVISSASGKEYAYEAADWNNGVFTYSLLSGLKSAQADNNKDKAIQVSELRDYVSNNVRALTNGKQNPTARKVNLYSDFTLVGKVAEKYETTAYQSAPKAVAPSITSTAKKSAEPANNASTSPAPQAAIPEAKPEAKQEISELKAEKTYKTPKDKWLYVGGSAGMVVGKLMGFPIAARVELYPIKHNPVFIGYKLMPTVLSAFEPNPTFINSIDIGYSPFKNRNIKFKGLYASCNLLLGASEYTDSYEWSSISTDIETLKLNYGLTLGFQFNRFFIEAMGIFMDYHYSTTGSNYKEDGSEVSVAFSLGWMF